MDDRQQTREELLREIQALRRRLKERKRRRRGDERRERPFRKPRHGPIRTPDGRIIGAARVVRSVTEGRRAASDLRRREEEYRTLVENLPTTIVAKYDRNRRVLYMSPAVERVLGRSPAEFIGKRPAEAPWPPELAPQLDEGIDQVFTTGAERFIQYSFRPQSGSVRHRALRLSPIRNAAGDVEAAIAFSYDVTELKEMEASLRRATAEAEEKTRELRRSQALLTAVSELSNMMFYAKDLEGRLLMVNPGLLALLGREEAEVIGQTSREIYATGVGEEHMANDREVMASGQARAFEEVADTPRGRRVFLSVKSPYRDESGRVVGLVGASMDITRQKRLEEELRQATERAEQASRAKSAFLANMSHEIRTPMNGVLGMTGLALAACAEPEARRYLRLVEESGQALLHIVNDILDLSRIEAGRLELERKPFSLREVVASATSPLAVTAQAKGVEVSRTVDPALPDGLIGDAGRLRQVLTNVVGNAVKYTERGRVSVSVAPAADRPGAPGRVWLLFRVTDSGAGIPADKLGAVFETFVTGVSSSHAQYGGTGLGLSISKELVQRMGGSIGAESEVGRGSAFTIALEFETAQPDVSAAPGAPEASGTPAERREPRRILLVEDNPVNQLLGVELLRRRGHRVSLAATGEQALEALRRESFDIVLMDIRMPGMDGVEAARRARAGEAGEKARHVCIIALTAHALRGDRERFLASGMDDYVSKPIDLDELAAALERISRKRCGAAQAALS